MNALALETAVLSADGNELVILDQTLLPNEIRYLHLTKKEEIWEAINKLRVRGAPAIGVAAAYGLYVVARTFDCHDSASFIASLKNAAVYLDSSRPTAVNLSWALRRMVRKAEENASCAVHELLDVLRKEEYARCRHGKAEYQMEACRRCPACIQEVALPVIIANAHRDRRSHAIVNHEAEG